MPSPAPTAARPAPAPSPAATSTSKAPIPGVAAATSAPCQTCATNAPLIADLIAACHAAYCTLPVEHAELLAQLEAVLLDVEERDAD